MSIKLPPLFFSIVTLAICTLAICVMVFAYFSYQESREVWLLMSAFACIQVIVVTLTSALNRWRV